MVFSPIEDFEWKTDGWPWPPEGAWHYVGNDTIVNIPHQLMKNGTLTDVISYYFMFYQTNVEKVISTNSNIINMECMFEESNATSLDLSELDTSNVTNMAGMFILAQATTLNLNNFDTSNVTNMEAMFYGVEATVLDLSSFDMSGVTETGWMFDHAAAATLGWARTQADVDILNATSGKPETLTFRHLKKVWTPEDLDNVRNDLEGHYVQMADIDLGGSWAEGEGWQPIGGPTWGERFKGSYDGNGFKISGLTINRLTDSYVGLFGMVNVWPKIMDFELKNITIQHADIKGDQAIAGVCVSSLSASAKNIKIINSNVIGTNQTGGAFGLANSTIVNCSVINSEIFSSGENDWSRFGGVVGHLDGSIFNSFSINTNITANTSNNNTIGGICGYSQAFIENCYSQNGTLSIENGIAIGGLVGISDFTYGDIFNCYASNIISGSAVYMGGLVGFL